MPMKTMKDLLVHQLNELYAAEKHSAKVLSKLATHAADKRLCDTFRNHAEETREHLERLDAVFDGIGIKPRASRAESAGMKGLCQDCLDLAEMPGIDPYVRDAALIAVAQHVEHDEIAGYGCARTWADLLGYDDEALKLEQTLSEERKADLSLTNLARNLNKAAMSASSA